MPFPTSTPLNIALVCLHTSPASDPGIGDAGGMNVVVRNQAAALGALGHNVEIFTRRSSADQPEAVELCDNVTLHFLNAGPPHPVAKGLHEEYIAEFSAALAAYGPFDVIHSHHWFSGMAALPIARERGLPHVQSFHSIAANHGTPLAEGERPESAGRLAGEKLLARESEMVVAISAAEAETVVHRLGGTPDRVRVVAPGVDSSLFHPGSRTEQPYAVAAGRLDPLKGFDLAIRAIAALPERLRLDLVIAGEQSVDYQSYPDELRSLASELGIGSAVRFIGPQSRADLAALLRGAAIVVVPSHSETYGLVALEASASGTPVIAAAAGGLREAVVDGVTGLVIGSRDPAVWADTISRVLDDPGLAESLSTTARVRAVGLSWAHSADALVAVYRDLSPDRD